MSGEADKAERLARALRANLRRRKAGPGPGAAPEQAPEPAPRDPSPREDADDGAPD